MTATQPPQELTLDESRVFLADVLLLIESCGRRVRQAEQPGVTTRTTQALGHTLDAAHALTRLMLDDLENELGVEEDDTDA